MFKNCFLFVLLLSLSFVYSSAQDGTDSTLVSAADRGNYALLWEITGQDLSSPSYLFGSMHVRNKAVFEFPDSLLIALQTCEVFANEVHLDSAMQQVFQQFFDEQSYYNSDDFNFDDYAPMSFGEDEEEEESTEDDAADDVEGIVVEEEIENNDPLEDRQAFFRRLQLARELEERGNMSTMLDAYLMEVARGYGLELMGLERIEEHLSDDDEGPSFADWDEPDVFTSYFFDQGADLLSLYYNGDLDVINTYVSEHQSAFEEFDLTERNYIMANSMERVMPEKSLFAVVGAAHLPGEEGVIQILKDRGYQLRRVLPHFPDSIDFAALPRAARPWPTGHGPAESYSFATPLGVQFEMSDAVSEMFLSFDIGRGLGYTVLVADMLPDEYDDFDDTFFEQDNYNIVDKTEIEFNGIEGHAYTMKKPGEEIEFFKGRVFFRDHRVYYLQVGAYEEETIEDNIDIERFFAMFALPETDKGNKWQQITSRDGGFSLRMPPNYIYTTSDQYSYTDDFEQVSSKLHAYKVGVENPETWLWFHWVDCPSGEIVQDDSTYLYGAIEQLQEYINPFLEPGDIEEYQEYPSLPFAANYQRGLALNGRFVLRGNRLYTILEIGKKGNSFSKKFLPSFRLLPFETADLTFEQTLPDSAITFTLPQEAVTTATDRADDLYVGTVTEHHLHAVDSLSGSAYYIDAIRYHPLFGSPDTTKLFEEREEGFIGPMDSLLSSETILVQGHYPGRELLLSTEGTDVKHRAWLYIVGNYYVQQYVYGLDEYLFSSTVDSFFQKTTFSPDSIGLSLSMLQSKADTLLTAYQSGEEDQMREAFKALDIYHSFTPEDLPAMRECLRHDWTEIDITEEIQRNLVAAIGEFELASPTLVFEQIFQEVAPGSATREEVLRQLAAVADEESLATFFRLIRTDEEILTRGIVSYGPFFDSLSLFLDHFDEFERLLAEGKDNLQIWYLAETALLEMPEEAEFIKEYLPLFAQRGAEWLNNWQYSEATEDPELHDLEARAPLYVFDFYRAADTRSAPLIDQAIELFNREGDSWGAIQAARLLLEWDQSLPNRRLKELLQDPDIYFDMIKLLNEHEQLSLIRKRQYDELQIARHLLEEDFELYDVEATEITYKEVIRIRFRGESQRVYVFSFSDDNTDDRLAVVGMFSSDENDRTFLDEGLVNYTYFGVGESRLARRAKRLVQEMEDW